MSPSTLFQSSSQNMGMILEGWGDDIVIYITADHPAGILIL